MTEYFLYYRYGYENESLVYSSITLDKIKKIKKRHQKFYDAELELVYFNDSSEIQYIY